MSLTISRNTSNIEKIRSFYIGVLGFQELESKTDDQGLFRLKLAKPGLSWNLEFERTSNVLYTEPLIVFTKSQSEYEAIIASAAIGGYEQFTPTGRFLKNRGTTLIDPDGARVTIAKIFDMKKIKIAGVPEHFNYPWKLCLAQNAFANAGIDLQWTDVPEGTGKMCKMLREGETDIAVILTEGIVKDIAQGNPSKIVQQYVGSPLIWGIHVAANSSFTSLSDLEGKTAAISRIGSGSQLMAYVNAANQQWDLSTLKFEIVNTIDGAVQALKDGRADYFMWERFMTKPLCDSGVFRRIADCPTPWPCFVIAASNDLLDRERDLVREILDIINDMTARFTEIPGIAVEIAREFNQKLPDIETWLSLTHWSSKPIDEDLLNKVQNQLIELSLLDKKGNFADIVLEV